MIDHNYPIAKHFTITNNGIVAITAAEQHKLRTAQKTVGVIIEDGNDMNKTLSKGKNSKNAATIAGETSDNTTANSSNE